MGHWSAYPPTFPVPAPETLAFDGTNIWVAGQSAVGALSPSGATLGTFSAAKGCYGAIAFDGIHMWVANYNAGTVTKL